MIEPNEIDLTSLSCVAFDQHSSLPKVPAIYFCLMADATPVYIGETENLHRRWNCTHDKKMWCRDVGVSTLAWLPFVVEGKSGFESRYERKAIEKLFVNHWRPKLNTVFPAHRK
jgi:hypothetical protein